MRLIDGQPCAAGLRNAVAQAPATPAPSPSPSLPPAPLGPGHLYATPFPTSSPVTPPPVPTPTPQSSSSPGPVLLQRSSAPPSIAPVGQAASSPSPEPTGIPTLPPGEVAVQADKFTGNVNAGKPVDAIGNVHIFYRDEVLVGQRAHFDGVRFTTVTGNPYIINNTKNTVTYTDRITFDNVTEQAELQNARGESSQGVEHGLLYFQARDLRSDEHGVAHGDYANVTTCERPRAGYHLTGRTIDVYPSDRIVLSKVVLYLGALAVFYLPRLVIPLRTVSDERQRTQFFPDVGYNSYQGFYIKTRLGFGKNQYYYGYYRIEFYTKAGIGLGYTAYIGDKKGRRQTSVDFYGINDRRQKTATYNLNLQDIENFRPSLRGQFGYQYVSNYGPLVNLPPNTNLTAQVVHSGQSASQTYTFARAAVGSQSSQDNLGFTDTRTYGTTLNNSLDINMSRSDTNYGGFASQNATGSFDDLLHWSSRGADYQLTFDRSFSQTPFGLNKEPELQIRPSYTFLQHFIFPISPTFTFGRYNEPQTPLTTSRADVNVSMGPALYKIFNSDFSANVTLNQFAYGTGDLKASIQQILTLATPIGSHITNNVTYNETNYNGPPFVPFATIDQQPTTNYKNAADVLRFFNGDHYNLSLNFATSFNALAQPVSYQLAVRPSEQSYVALGGAFVPGPSQGFYTTNLQFATPLGRGAMLQFVGDVDWKNKGRIENKNIYYSRIIGDCYEFQVQYSQASRQVNFTVSLLAFPSHAASFGLNTTGSIIPSSLNGFNI